jgi:hypothetical protein
MMSLWKKLASHYRGVIFDLLDAGTSGPCRMGAHGICKLHCPPYCLCSCHNKERARLVTEDRQRRASYERSCGLARGDGSNG